MSGRFIILGEKGSKSLLLIDKEQMTVVEIPHDNDDRVGSISAMRNEGASVFQGIDTAIVTAAAVEAPSHRYFASA